eukprot:584980-Pyramimonas_sp.AAC.1
MGPLIPGPSGSPPPPCPSAGGGREGGAAGDVSEQEGGQIARRPPVLPHPRELSLQPPGGGASVQFKRRAHLQPRWSTEVA